MLFLKKLLLKKKSLSPLITTILLIIVTFALVGIVLSWGKGFTNNTKTTLDTFSNTYTKNDSAMFKATNFINNNLIIKDLMSDANLEIVGIRVPSDYNLPGLNEIITLPEPLFFSVGRGYQIEITRPPERIFKVQLITSDNHYITVSNILNYNLEAVSPTITSPSNGSSFSTDTNILFSQTTTGGDGINSCVWKSEETTISTSCNDFNYSFDSGGTKAISLKVTDAEDNTKAVNNSIIIHPPLLLSITSPSNNSINLIGSSIDFNSSISGGTGSYRESEFSTLTSGSSDTMFVQTISDDKSFFAASTGEPILDAIDMSATFDTATVNISNTLETGTVEKGSKSDQEFTVDSTTFNTYHSWQSIWKILPESTKPITKESLTVFCTNCGAKRKKTNHKFCPICGSKF
jgi:flagellin-like protein